MCSECRPFLLLLEVLCFSRSSTSRGPPHWHCTQRANLPRGITFRFTFPPTHHLSSSASIIARPPRCAAILSFFLSVPCSSDSSDRNVRGELPIYPFQLNHDTSSTFMFFKSSFLWRYVRICSVMISLTSRGPLLLEILYFSRSSSLTLHPTGQPPKRHHLSIHISSNASPFLQRVHHRSPSQVCSNSFFLSFCSLLFRFFWQKCERGAPHLPVPAQPWHFVDLHVLQIFIFMKICSNLFGYDFSTILKDLTPLRTLHP